MKRKTREVEKRTFTLKNAFPRFISIVSRGANLAPLSELRYAEGETFSDVEIHQIVFSKEKFTRESVEAYLADNDYEDYSIEEDTATYIVPGLPAEQFERYNEIEYADGVKFFVGAVKKEEVAEVDQTTTAVVDAEVLDFQTPDAEVVQESAEPEEVVTDTQEVAEADVVQEGDLSVEDLQPTKDEVVEEKEPESAEGASEEGTDEFQAPSEEVEQAEAEVVQEAEPEPQALVFNDRLYRERAEQALAAFIDALEAAKTEAFSVPSEEVFTAEQVAEQVAAAVEQASAKFADNKNIETVENTVDESVILVQNSQAVNTDEITTVPKDEKTEKFSQRRSNDLFGLR